MESIDINAYIDFLTSHGGEKPSAEEICAILDRYPFFSIAAEDALNINGLTDEQRNRLMARVAINAPDHITLFRLVDPAGSKLSDFYPSAVPDTPSTDSAIDTFLNTYGSSNPREEAILERMIFNPVPDYSVVLASQEAQASATESSQDRMLDAFLESRNAKPAPAVPQPTPEAADAPMLDPDPDSSLNESLAQFFIKQHSYDKAYEIIRQLSLNFPEKSVYFADQMRFLKKLILNKKHFKK